MHFRRRGKFAVFFCALSVLPLTGLQVSFLSSLLKSPPAAEIPGQAVPAPPPSGPEAPPIRSAIPVLRTIDGSIKKGTGFADNLVRMGLTPGQAHEAVAQLEPLLDFRRLHPGDRFTLSFGPEDVMAGLSYRTGPLEEVRLEKTTAGWETGQFTLPSETRVESITGKIESSLFESLDSLGERDRLAMDFVDILAWDIDFSHELRRGDTFRIVVEKIYREGSFLMYGRILAAEYLDSEELHQAYYYPYPPESGGYYSPEGQSVRKTFLKAPVSYSRISSGFSYRRLHPILKKVQPHLGVDYAAPTGTPVWAPADGTVLSATYDRRNGRKVVLRHPNGYRTYFLHLSRFGKGIKAGKRVSQKDVIGYVGSTGRSTGPHLDYRMKRYGRWRNPLKEKFPPGKPLPEEYLAEFAQYREWLSGKLSSPPDTLPTAFLQ